MSNSPDSTNNEWGPGDNGASVRLRSCDLNKCEARCCYDGVYLEAGEAEKIGNIVASAPEFFNALPPGYIVDGSWGNGRVTGKKTAVRPHDFKAKDFPTHFNRTRCVFCSEDHKCSLQVLAVQRGLHKWAYKPKACWTFPMELVDGEPAPPPARNEPDPNSLGNAYPGYAKFVPCGQDRPDGEPWEEILADEIAYWRETEIGCEKNTGVPATNEKRRSS